MVSSRSRSEGLPRRAATALIAVASLGYPALVYLGIGVAPGWLFAAVLLAVLTIRAGLRRRRPDPIAPVLWAACLATLLLAALAPELGAKSYPVLVNAALALLFGFSLLRPPSVVERIARLADPSIPGEATRYLRNVTAAWVVFFVVNGSVSTWTALQGSWEAWTLYNGLISYLLIGVMFAGELTVRRVVIGRAGRAAP
jgi:uncharacterized membrane protein